MENRTQIDERIDWKYVTLVMIAFAILYFATAFYMSLAETVERYQIQRDGPLIPVTVDRDGQTIGIELTKRDINNSWAYVEVEIVNSAKKTVGTFGMDFYHESGFDRYDNAHWTESQLTTDVQYSFPEKGAFFLKFKEQKAKNGQTTKRFNQPQFMEIKLTKYHGSEVPFAIWGAILLFGGIIMNEFASYMRRQSSGVSHLSE